MIVFSPTGDNIGSLSLSYGSGSTTRWPSLLATTIRSSKLKRNFDKLKIGVIISVNDSSSYISRMMKFRRRDGIKYVNGSISLRNKSTVSNFRDSISVLVDFRDCGIDWYVTMNSTFC